MLRPRLHLPLSVTPLRERAGCRLGDWCSVLAPSQPPCHLLPLHTQEAGAGGGCRSASSLTGLPPSPRGRVCRGGWFWRHRVRGSPAEPFKEAGTRRVLPPSPASWIHTGASHTQVCHMYTQVHHTGVPLRCITQVHHTHRGAHAPTGASGTGCTCMPSQTQWRDPAGPRSLCPHHCLCHLIPLSYLFI